MGCGVVYQKGSVVLRAYERRGRSVRRGEESGDRGQREKRSRHRTVGGLVGKAASSFQTYLLPLFFSLTLLGWAWLARCISWKAYLWWRKERGRVDKG